jgi:hypothetical protein
MKNPKIYFVTILLILIALNIFKRNYLKRKNEVIVTASVWPRSANSFLNYKQATELYSTSGTRQVEAALLDQCSMKTCFDFAKCNSIRPLKIHIMTQNDHTLNSAIYKRSLNLTKNSSLAVAIGYPDVVSIANTAINQTGRAVECIALIMVVYLSTSLLTSVLMNWYNALSEIKER